MSTARRGPRLSAFFTNGLRYMDIDIVLQRAYGRIETHLQHQTEIGEEAIATAKKFVYNDAAFLLAIAVAVTIAGRKHQQGYLDLRAVANRSEWPLRRLAHLRISLHQQRLLLRLYLGPRTPED